MARVTFNPNSPIQALSGTYCGATYRTLPSGKTVVHFKSRPAEIEGNTDDYINSPERARLIIDECVSCLQHDIPDIQEAIRRRLAIKRQVSRIYSKIAVELFPNDHVLVEHILHAYRNANTRHNLPSRKKSQKCTLFSDSTAGQ